MLGGTRSTKEDKPLNKEDIVVTENELSFRRWIGTIVVGILIGSVFMVILGMGLEKGLKIMPAFQEGGSLADQTDYIVNMAAMAGLFAGFIIALKAVGKTSPRAFIFNAGRTSGVDMKKEVLPILGFYLLGLLITELPNLGNIAFAGKSAGKILFLVVFDLLFIWMQTSWEEFIFRGFPLRLICRNDIGLNARSILVAVVTSLLFMSAHIPNPEVQTLSGTQAVFMTLSYFVSGFGFFLSDLLVGSLLPGLLIHWINNFCCILLLSQEVSVAGASSIWVDRTPSSGLSTLTATIIVYAPVIIYLIMKRKTGAVSGRQNKDLQE